MAVTATPYVSTINTTNNANKSVSDSFIPSGVLPFCIIVGTGNSATQGCTDNSADGLGGSYTLIASTVKNASADKGSILIRNAPLSINNESGLTFTSTGLTVSTGGGIWVCYLTGSAFTGASAVRSVSGTPNVAIQDNGAAAGTPQVVFPNITLTANAIMGFNWNTTNGVNPTAPTGFIRGAGQAYGTPATGIATYTANGGITATTVTWGATSPTAHSSMLIEFDGTAVTVVIPPQPNIVSQTAVRAALRAAKLTYGWTRNKSGLLIPEMGWS